MNSGAGAVLVSSTWRQGGFTVFNFEVEDQHNYFVRAPGSQAASVLVHNSPSCFARRTMRDAASAVAPNDRGGKLTAAGRALAKHASPPGSNNFSPHPRYAGVDNVHDVDTLNAWGAELVDEMIESSDAVWSTYSNGRTSVKLPDGTGAIWNADGSFRGFLDP